MKRIKEIIIMIIAGICLIPTFSYSAFYDLEYPPDNKGRVDYSDEEADEEKSKKDEKTSEYKGKSSNNFLKTLRVENAQIEPQFNRQYVDYNVNLEDKNIKKINIIAEPENENAKIEGAGEIELEDGINDLRVVVTAENGNVQIYNLHIELPFKQSELELTKLQVYGINIKTGEKEIEKLKPSFDPKKYEYDIKVKNEITSLYIERETDEGNYIETNGAEDLQVGKNKVIIKVKSNNDESKTTTYVINIERQEDEINKNIFIYIGGIIILIIIFAIITKKGHPRK
jgi:hypothetical protein